MLQGQRDLVDGVEADPVGAGAAGQRPARRVFYVADRRRGGDRCSNLLASYAYNDAQSTGQPFELGEGLVGQCALEKKRILLTNVPGDYVQISSGLGEAAPLNIVVLPVLFEGEVKAVIELASFDAFSEIHQTFLDQLTEAIGIVLNTIAANMRTEGLLKQSQSLTARAAGAAGGAAEDQRPAGAAGASLRKSEELLRTSRRSCSRPTRSWRRRPTLLVEQNQQVEAKNREVEQAARRWRRRPSSWR